MCCGAPSSFMWLGFSKSCSASPQVSCCAVATALVVASLLYTSFKLQPVTQHLTLSPHVSYFSLRARSAHPVWMMPINWRSAEQQATCAHVIGYVAAWPVHAGMLWGPQPWEPHSFWEPQSSENSLCTCICMCMHVYVRVYRLNRRKTSPATRIIPRSRGRRWPMKTHPRDPCKRTCLALVVHLGAFKSQLVATIAHIYIYICM